MNPGKLTVEVEVVGLDKLEHAAELAERVSAAGRTVSFRVFRFLATVLLGVLLAGLFGCGEAEAAPEGVPLPEWQRVGDRLHRQIDHELGVVCYRAYTGSDGMSCVSLAAVRCPLQPEQLVVPKRRK